MLFKEEVNDGTLFKEVKLYCSLEEVTHIIGYFSTGVAKMKK